MSKMLGWLLPGAKIDARPLHFLGVDIVTTPAVKPGQVVLLGNDGRVFVNPFTWELILIRAEARQIVWEGIKEAHPWLRMPPR